MKRLLSIILSTLICSMAVAQAKPDKKTKAAVDLGKVLYLHQTTFSKASQIVLKRYKEMPEKYSGYITYFDNNKAKCVFYNRGIPIRALLSITFNTDFSEENADIDEKERPLTPMENDLFSMRENTFARFDNDTLINQPANAFPIIIPIISKDKKEAYVICSPTQKGSIFFGNDYLLSFDKNNQVKKVKSLHKNIETPVLDETKQIPKDSFVTIIHVHDGDDYLSATDICTIMYYEEIGAWNQCLIISSHLIISWNCKTNSIDNIVKRDLRKELHGGAHYSIPTLVK